MAGTIPAMTAGRAGLGANHGIRTFRRPDRRRRAVRHRRRLSPADAAARARATPSSRAASAIGGTWDLFRYPGIRSDSDMFTLGYSLQAVDRSRRRSPTGPSILNYVRETAAEQRHRPEHPLQPPGEARVVVVARRALDGGGRADGRRGATAIVRFTCNFLFMCSGYYDYEAGYTPEFPGIERFSGPIVHPQHWPEDLDYAGKRVVVIGSRRDGRDAGAGDGQDGRRTSRCCSARRPTWSRVRPRTRSPTSCGDSFRRSSPIT